MKIARQDKEPKVRQLADSILIEWSVIKPPVDAPEKAGRFFNPIEENAEYILIPGGSYKFSVTSKMVQVPDLYFAKYPVTNKMYKIFLDSLPQWKQDKHRSSYADDKRFNGEDQPVVGVKPYSAKAYCEWLTEQNAKSGGQNEKVIFRLPNEEEWEWAASGGKREYPWGNEKPDDMCTNYDGKVGQTTSVGSYPAGATPEGLMDMAGNVLEWIEHWHDKNKVVHVLRGGSWILITEYLRCAARGARDPVGNTYDIGFRVICAPVTVFDTPI